MVKLLNLKHTHEARQLAPQTVLGMEGKSVVVKGLQANELRWGCCALLKFVEPWCVRRYRIIYILEFSCPIHKIGFFTVDSIEGLYAVALEMLANQLLCQCLRKHFCQNLLSKWP